MANRLSYSAGVEISSSPVLEQKDLGLLAFAGRSDALTEASTRKVVLAGGATDVAVDLDGITTVKFLAMQVAGVNGAAPTGVLLKKNSTGDAGEQVKPLSGVSVAHRLETTDGVTSLFMTNLDATNPVEVVLSLAGV
jgi:hypothetical protein